jgi:hypothetical protein
MVATRSIYGSPLSSKGAVVSRKQRVEEQRRREFEAEARRQSREAAAAARNPESDEAQTMRELDALLDESASEWK